MKSGFFWTALCLWSLIAITVIVIFIGCMSGMFGGISGFFGSGDALLKSEDISHGDVRNIAVEGSYHVVDIRKTDGSIVKVSQYGRAKSNGENLFSTDISGESIRVYVRDARIFRLFNFWTDERLVIEIPESFTGNLNVKSRSGGARISGGLKLDGVTLQSSSGGIYINESLEADTLDVNVTSGGIRLNGDVAVRGDVTLKSSSGSVHSSESLTAGKLSANSSSGGIRLGEANVANYYLQSSSGGINIGGISGGGEAKSTSGGIRIGLQNPKGNVTLNSSSGSINVTLEPTLQFTLDAQVNSGSVHTNFPAQKNEKGNKATAQVGDNPVVNIIARATSGGIRVQS